MRGKINNSSKSAHYPYSTNSYSSYKYLAKLIDSKGENDE